MIVLLLVLRLKVARRVWMVLLVILVCAIMETWTLEAETTLMPILVLVSVAKKAVDIFGRECTLVLISETPVTFLLASRLLKLTLRCIDVRVVAVAVTEFRG